MDQTSCSRIYVERTLAIIKPDAIDKAEEIEDIILKSGFTILQVGQSVSLNTALDVDTDVMDIFWIKEVYCRVMEF